MDLNWFQVGTISPDVINGFYDYKLVALSYIIAVLASYVALDFVGRLRAENNPNIKWYWLAGGSFAMGAGIWSMHFIGMLAFILPMPMGYELSWTTYSLIAAVLVSGLALYVLRSKEYKTSNVAIGGIFIGIGIATMHYMGMQGMQSHINIHYLPGLFFLSIAIAIFAAEAALWLLLQSNVGSLKRQFNLKLISALVMGIAICGMHYTGMASAIFTPLSHPHQLTEIIEPTLLAVFIAGVTGLIISLALTVSSYYKQMVVAVQNEKEFLNAMLDNLEDGIIACDPKGHITVLNDALQQNIPNKNNKSIDSLANYFQLYPLNSHDSLPKEKTPLYRALRGERIHALELLMVFKNGISRDVVIDGQPIINVDGKNLGAVIVIHDVTELKQTEKLKREFVSVVSHELRTPLTSILGSLGLILGGETGELSEKTLKLLDIAIKNCNRLHLIINDILDMEKIQAGNMKFEFKVADIADLVNDAIIANKTYDQESGISIQLVRSVSKVYVHVDPDRLMQVIANLLSNALKFSPHDGIVKVEIRCLDEKVRVSVTDTGPGIPIEFQPRIFQKFSQADTSSSRGKTGTGLGLCISKAIIEKLDGSLQFISKPDEETTFYFDLPIYRSENVLINKAENKEAKSNNKKLLICEDDDDQAQYLRVLLESEGIEADVCHSAAEAKKMLSENHYQALLLDILLPDKDGITFIRYLRSDPKFRDIPIIVLSVMAKMGKTLLNGDAFSVVDWLDKPINQNNLLHALESIRRHKKKKLPRILHIEDDVDTQRVIKSLLETEAEIEDSMTIKDAQQKLAQQNYDLVILDLLLPDGNGVILIPAIAKNQLPIMVYSSQELDREYSHYVREVLIKSKTSNKELLETIKKLLET